MRIAFTVFVLAVAMGAAAQDGAAPPHVIFNPNRVPLAPVPALDQKTVKARIAALIPEAQTKGSSSATPADYGTYKIQISVRTASGGAEVHAHWDDVMMVEQGSATLVTGGTVVGGKTDADGETHGLKIEGGQSQTLTPGDMVTVRAGTPHQIMLAPGTVYAAVVVKIHEP
jgi:mannose-6-phosphate isomerase-like protein (cupin superfamily)